MICGWLWWIVRSARIQREAVAAIETDGTGGVTYDWDRGAGLTDARGSPAAPGWLVDLVGVDYFGRVRSVVLLDARPATIAAVSRLSGLRRLAINGHGLRDTDLAPLEHLTELSELVLSGDPATDAGLKDVNGLTSLRKLVLVNSAVTDSGLSQLKPLKNLSVLGLGFARITDDGLANLKGLTTLTRLDLRGTRVTDDGIKEIQQVLPGVEITR